MSMWAPVLRVCVASANLHTDDTTCSDYNSINTLLSTLYMVMIAAAEIAPETTTVRSSFL